MSDKTVNIAFRGTEEFRDRLQHAAIQRKIKVQEMIRRALEVYLSGDPAAEVAAARAAQRVAEEQQGPPGHQPIFVPDGMVDTVRSFIKWLSSQKPGP